MKKMKIGNKIYDVISMEEYRIAPEIYDSKFTAIEEHGVVLPLKQKTDFGPGYYMQPNSMVNIVEKPDESVIDEYSQNNIIDYNNAKTIQDIINKNKNLRDIQSEFIVDDDNILNLTIRDSNTPEMKAIKEAINAKQADKSQYESKFTQYQNDMRILTKSDSITLAKLVSMCDIFDISATLILEDKPGAPNPMDKIIQVDLTEGRS